MDCEKSRVAGFDGPGVLGRLVVQLVAATRLQYRICGGLARGVSRRRHDQVRPVPVGRTTSWAKPVDIWWLASESSKEWRLQFSRGAFPFDSICQQACRKGRLPLSTCFLRHYLYLYFYLHRSTTTSTSPSISTSLNHPFSFSLSYLILPLCFLYRLIIGTPFFPTTPSILQICSGASPLSYLRCSSCFSMLFILFDALHPFQYFPCPSPFSSLLQTLWAFTYNFIPAA